MSRLKKTILFVCTGNTCRSPMAELLANEFLRERQLPFVARSAGVSTLDGALASAPARQVVEEFGLSLGDHRARVLTSELIDQAELVLALGVSHRDYVHVLSPSAMHVHELRDYATQGKESHDVSDPVGESLETYRETYTDICSLIESALDRFTSAVAGQQEAEDSQSKK